jgi:hypothetical protein
VSFFVLLFTSEKRKEKIPTKLFEPKRRAQGAAGAAGSVGKDDGQLALLPALGQGVEIRSRRCAGGYIEMKMT